MADVATIGLIHARASEEKTALSEQLQHALNSRIVIEQAKGKLSGQHGISVNDAFWVLRQHSRRHGTLLTDVATQVLDGTVDVPHRA